MSISTPRLPGCEHVMNLNNLNPKQSLRQNFPETLRPLKCVGAGRIVLVTTGGLGDTIVFSPVFRAVRRAFPRAEIMLVTASPLVQDLYSPALELDRIGVIDTNRKLSPALYARLWLFGVRCRRGNGTDIMVCASRLSPWLIRLFKAVCRPRNVIAMTFPPEDVSDLEVNTALACQLAPGNSAPAVFVPVTAETSARVQTMLRQKYGIEDTGCLIAVYPSVVKPKHPCWSLYHLIRVASGIASLINGTVVVVGGADEGRECEATCGKNKVIFNLAGVLTISETAALLAQIRLAICNDGGIMHLAGAVGCSMVAIMSGVSRYYQPPGEFVRVITPSVTEGTACGIESIAEETVYKAAKELLDATA